MFIKSSMRGMSTCQKLCLRNYQARQLAEFYALLLMKSLVPFEERGIFTLDVIFFYSSIFRRSNTSF